MEEFNGYFEDERELRELNERNLHADRHCNRCGDNIGDAVGLCGACQKLQPAPDLNLTPPGDHLADGGAS